MVVGGSERQYSIANALKLVPEACDVVLVHDAARPLISIETIEEVVEAARVHGAAIAAVRHRSRADCAAVDCHPW